MDFNNKLDQIKDYKGFIVALQQKGVLSENTEIIYTSRRTGGADHAPWFVGELRVGNTTYKSQACRTVKDTEQSCAREYLLRSGILGSRSLPLDLLRRLTTENPIVNTRLQMVKEDQVSQTPLTVIYWSGVTSPGTSPIVAFQGQLLGVDNSTTYQQALIAGPFTWTGGKVAFDFTASSTTTPLLLGLVVLNNTDTMSLPDQSLSSAMMLVGNSSYTVLCCARPTIMTSLTNTLPQRFSQNFDIPAYNITSGQSIYMVGRGGSTTLLQINVNCSGTLTNIPESSIVISSITNPVTLVQPVNVAITGQPIGINVTGQPIGVNVDNTPSVTISGQPINVDVLNVPNVVIADQPINVDIVNSSPVSTSITYIAEQRAPLWTSSEQPYTNPIGGPDYSMSENSNNRNNRLSNNKTTHSINGNIDRYTDEQEIDDANVYALLEEQELGADYKKTFTEQTLKSKYLIVKAVQSEMKDNMDGDDLTPLDMQKIEILGMLAYMIDPIKNLNTYNGMSNNYYAVLKNYEMEEVLDIETMTEKNENRRPEIKKKRGVDDIVLEKEMNHKLEKQRSDRVNYKKRGDRSMDKRKKKVRLMNSKEYEKIDRLYEKEFISDTMTDLVLNHVDVASQVTIVSRQLLVDRIKQRKISHYMSQAITCWVKNNKKEFVNILVGLLFRYELFKLVFREGCTSMEARLFLNAEGSWHRDLSADGDVEKNPGPTSEDETIEITVNETPDNSLGMTQDMIAKVGEFLPRYGNYGGSGYTAGGSEGKVISKVPVDAMDKAFMIHDIEYGHAKGTDDIVRADRDLLDRLNLVNKEELDTYGRMYLYAAKTLLPVKISLQDSKVVKAMNTEPSIINTRPTEYNNNGYNEAMARQRNRMMHSYNGNPFKLPNTYEELKNFPTVMDVFTSTDDTVNTFKTNTLITTNMLNYTATSTDYDAMTAVSLYQKVGTQPATRAVVPSELGIIQLDRVIGFGTNGPIGNPERILSVIDILDSAVTGPFYEDSPKLTDFKKKRMELFATKALNSTDVYGFNYVSDYNIIADTNTIQGYSLCQMVLKSILNMHQLTNYVQGPTYGQLWQLDSSQQITQGVALRGVTTENTIAYGALSPYAPLTNPYPYNEPSDVIQGFQLVAHVSDVPLGQPYVIYPGELINYFPGFIMAIAGYPSFVSTARLGVTNVLLPTLSNSTVMKTASMVRIKPLFRDTPVVFIVTGTANNGLFSTGPNTAGPLAENTFIAVGPLGPVINIGNFIMTWVMNGPNDPGWTLPQQQDFIEHILKNRLNQGLNLEWGYHMAAVLSRRYAPCTAPISTEQPGYWTMNGINDVMGDAFDMLSTDIVQNVTPQLGYGYRIQRDDQVAINRMFLNLCVVPDKALNVDWSYDIRSMDILFTLIARYYRGITDIINYVNGLTSAERSVGLVAPGSALYSSLYGLIKLRKYDHTNRVWPFSKFYTTISNKLTGMGLPTTMSSDLVMSGRDLQVEDFVTWQNNVINRNGAYYHNVYDTYPLALLPPIPNEPLTIKDRYAQQSPNIVTAIWIPQTKMHVHLEIFDIMDDWDVRNTNAILWDTQINALDFEYLDVFNIAVTVTFYAPPGMLEILNEDNGYTFTATNNLLPTIPITGGWRRSRSKYILQVDNSMAYLNPIIRNGAMTQCISVTDGDVGLFIPTTTPTDGYGTGGPLEKLFLHLNSSPQVKTLGYGLQSVALQGESKPTQ